MVHSKLFDFAGSAHMSVGYGDVGCLHLISERICRLSSFRRRDALFLGSISGVTMFLGGCVSWLGGKQGGKKIRSAKFTEYTSTEVVVKTDLPPVEKRMPGIGVVEAHWVSRQKESGRFDLPAPEPRYWFHLVAKLNSDSVEALVKASTGAVDVLPGIQPDLRQYVPADDVYVSVPKEKADEIFDVEHVQDGGKEVGSDSFYVDQLVVSSNSNLIVVIGKGIRRQ